MKTGDKVICVDFRINQYHEERPPLVPGLVYVVSEAGLWGDEPFINLLGVKSPHATVGWKASRFRKLEELRQSGASEQHEPCPITR